MGKRYRRVELLGVPNYYQGTHDSLCTYYAAAMLLATLHPEYQDSFGCGARCQRAGLKVDDPLVKNFPRSKNDSIDRVFSSWFYRGASLKEACKALNVSMEEDSRDTRFEYDEYTHHSKNFDLITRNIDEGLPVMIGWTTVDYGVHCSLVIGYRKTSRRWLILNDPTTGRDEVCWEVLKDIDKSSLSLVRVDDSHDGPRPDRLTMVFNGQNLNISKQIDRWWPHEGELHYHPIAELYEMAKG